MLYPNLRVKFLQIDDALQNRYKPPYPKIHEFKGKQKSDNVSSDFVVKLSKYGVGFVIIRKTDGTIL